MSRRREGSSGRARGSIDALPSGALRVRVYAGLDPVTKRRHNLTELIPAGPGAERRARAARDRLVSQIEERRNPRTNATVDQLIERYLDQFDGAAKTLSLYRGYVRNHISPFLGHIKVGDLDADVLDSFYAELRRCRDHCFGRRFTQHRTKSPHECDHRCGPHRWRPLGPTTIRHMHFILSGAFKGAVRWKWVTVSPIGQSEPPAAPSRTRNRRARSRRRGSEADQCAASGISSSMPARPVPIDATERAKSDPQKPYERIAVKLRRRILAGELRDGDAAPTEKQLADEHGVAAGTAHRAMELLKTWGLVTASRGRRAVVNAPAPVSPEVSATSGPVRGAGEPCDGANFGETEEQLTPRYWAITLRGPDGRRYPPRHVSANVNDPDSFRPHLVAIARIEAPGTPMVVRAGSAITSWRSGSLARSRAFRFSRFAGRGRRCAATWGCQLCERLGHWTRAPLAGHGRRCRRG